MNLKKIKNKNFKDKLFVMKMIILNDIYILITDF